MQRKVNKEGETWVFKMKHNGTETGTRKLKIQENKSSKETKS